MIKLNRLDLDFLHQQATIGIDYTQLQDALDPRGVRETAGTNNNLVGHGAFGNPATDTPGPDSGFGAAGEEFIRLSQAFDENGDPVGSTYAPYGQSVVDASPRTISNLVSNSWTDPSSPIYNPAAVAALATWGGNTVVDPNGNETAFIPNVGALGGSSYNNWFTFFGQFFDHGLDFISKDGSSGFVMIPLSPNDPLYAETANTGHMMIIARANLENPDSDYVDPMNPVELKAGVTPIYNNNTGLSIDQSQTYGSDPSVNAFLREYDVSGVKTGYVLSGNTAVDPAVSLALNAATDGLATWADIKVNALRIGVELTDADIFKAPMLRVDAKGEIQFTPDGTIRTTAQIVGFDPANQDPSDPYVRDANGNVQHTDQPFLIDVNPAANPNFHHDIDPNTGMEMDYNGLDYDADLLEAHYVVGDGRANENFALTSVHHVWHEEHNLQVDNIKSSVLAEAAIIASSGIPDAAAVADAYIAKWKIDPNDVNSDWDGELLFQAARAVTETEYNHVAVDEYIGRLIPDLAEFVSYSADINMAVSLEFSQSVFRFGHSMLTENLNLVDPVTGQTVEIPLLDAFLNPEGFAQYGPAAIAEGAIKQLASEVDEFVTPALQQTLVGMPLDLAAINIARGRDVGLPTWNEFRQQIHDGLVNDTSNSSNAGALAPYESWADVGAHLRNPETLVNLIAAYSHDAGIIAARDAGDLDLARSLALTAMSNPLFMQGTPTFDPATGDWTVTGGDMGFWDIDLWIGGLAERPLIDGILGTTFSYVFLDFAQRMQDGDRFYYLFRFPPGSSIGQEIIKTKFSEIIARNIDGLEFTDLNGDSFAYADRYFSPDATDGSEQYFTADPTGQHYHFNAATALIDDSDPTSIAKGGHIVITGGDGNDHLIAGDGDDTVHGGKGDDYIQGSQGNDTLLGGEGDDFIIDDENDDFIRGGAGNDIIFAGKGVFDTVFGDEGDDEIHGGDGIDELFGGEGNDEMFGDGDTDVIVGGTGNDYMDGGDSVDEMWGGFGNDIILGGVGDDHLNGGGGNDLLFGGLGPAGNDGDRFLGDALPGQNGQFEGPLGEDGFLAGLPGFDIASYENVGIAVTADLESSNENGTASNLIDTYAFIDGIVGTRFDDNLTGAGPDTITNNGIDNLLVGGGGNDVLTGLGGDDFIAGDWVVVNNDLQAVDGVDQQAFFDAQFEDKHGLNRTDTGDGAGLAWMGHVLGNNGPEGNNDVALFSGDFSDYTITDESNGITRVVDNRGIDSTSVGDRLKGIEWMQFNDVRRRVNNSPPMLGAAIVLTALIQDSQRIITAAELLGMGASEITDPDGDPLTVQSVQVDTGMVTDNGNDTWTFTPEPGDTSEVVFSYEVSDGTEAIAAQANLDLLPDGPDVVVVPPGGDGNDVLTGGPGNDIIEGGNGDDQILGLGGNDILFGDEGDDQIVGGDGNDVAFGGEGEDQIFGDLGNDMLFGGEGNDVIFGGDGNDIIQGGEGNDLLLGQAGNDIIDGGKDNDQIHGGLGKDMLTGGQDKDTFVFNTVAEAGNGALADVIADFQVGDKIDLSGIDANLGAGGNQSFALLNQATFTDAGQLIFRHDGGNTLLEGNVDGDNAADFRIDIVGQHNLTSSDFLGVA